MATAPPGGAGPRRAPCRRAAAPPGVRGPAGLDRSIHLCLWQEGYRQIPTDGPLFLLDAVAGFALAAALLTWPRPLTGLLAAGYAAATLGALVLSLTAGLFGFRESTSASYVIQSLAIEAITILALISWTVLTASRPLPEARRARASAANRGGDDSVPAKH
jgi:hypothetical protein